MPEAPAVYNVRTTRLSPELFDQVKAALTEALALSRSVDMLRSTLDGELRVDSKMTVFLGDAYDALVAAQGKAVLPVTEEDFRRFRPDPMRLKAEEEKRQRAAEIAALIKRDRELAWRSDDGPIDIPCGCS